MEYTKGKWIQYYRSEGNVIEEKTGRTIANCMSYSSNINSEKIINENLANAKLISKCPEMHQTLKEVQSDINIVGEVSKETLEKIIAILKELK